MMAISRRNIVKAAGAMAGAAMLGVSAAYAEEAPAIEWAGEADLVVVGYGNAGIGAAKVATDMGGTVIILEKAPKELAGGSLAANDGNWSYVTPEALVNGSFGKISQELAEEINNDGPQYSDWLAACGLEWIEKTNSIGQTVLAAPYGLAIWRAADSYFEDRDDVTILFETAGVELIRNAAGEVVGVVAENAGVRSNYRARKGVVIATGTYAGNKEIFQGLHYACLPYVLGTSPYNTGDGHVMAARIGAKAFQDTSLAVEFGMMAARRASEEVGSAVPMSDLYYKGVMVNGTGKRFMSEDVNMGHNKSTEPILTIKCTNKGGKNGNYGNGYYNLPAWVVFDEATFTSECLMKPFGWVAVRGLCPWSDDNMEEVEKGWILKADTLEDLAAQMVSTNEMTGEEVAVDVEAFLATIERYNEGVAAGADEFGKAEDYLVGIGEGPYYAVEVCPSVMYTNSGLAVNNDIQVLDWDENPIPGLYAAGDVASRQRATRICMTGNIVTAGHAARHAMEHEEHMA